jgi:hypothetical protein
MSDCSPVALTEYHELAFVDHPLGGPMVLRVRVDSFGGVRALKFDHRL